MSAWTSHAEAQGNVTLTARNRAILRAAAEVMVPEAVALADSAWRQLESIVEMALADRPPKVQRQLALLLRVIDLLPLARHGRRFTSLDVVARARIQFRVAKGATNQNIIANAGGDLVHAANRRIQRHHQINVRGIGVARVRRRVAPPHCGRVCDPVASRFSVRSLRGGSFAR